MLWVLVFLALLVAGFTVSLRSHVQGSAAEAARAQAAALAEAGAQLAIHDLVNALWIAGWQRRFAADGRAYSCTLDDGRVRLSIEDEAAKVDLNAAGDTLLRALLVGIGRSPGEAERLVAAILDYRDADDTRRPGGAEAEDYRRSGRLQGPKNGPFDSTLELAQVLGVDARLIDALRPFVTVHSGSDGVDGRRASPALVEALTAGAVSGPSGAGSGGLAVRPARLPPALAGVSPQRVFLVRSQATGERGGSMTLEAVVRISASRGRPFTMLAWRLAGTIEGADSIDLGPC